MIGLKIVLMPKREEQFLQRINAKQPEAFRELFSEFYNSLVLFAMGFVEQQDVAEDIVQETFVRGMEHGSQLEVLEESQRRAWLYRTAKNICIDRARRVQAEPPWEGETFQNDDLTKPMVMQLCGILEPQDRAMFWLRYFEDYTAAELGEMFGIPAATVRSRMLNARRRLQKYYPEIKR